MKELAKQFIGEECIIYTITSNDGSVQGVIKVTPCRTLESCRVFFCLNVCCFAEQEHCSAVLFSMLNLSFSAVGSVPRFCCLPSACNCLSWSGHA